MNLLVVGRGARAVAVVERLKSTGNRVHHWRSPGPVDDATRVVSDELQDDSSPIIEVVEGANEDLASFRQLLSTLPTADRRVVRLTFGEEGDLLSREPVTTISVSGRASPDPDSVRNGALRLLLSGDAEVVRGLEPLWMQMATSYAYCGTDGTDAVLKSALETLSEVVTSLRLKLGAALIQAGSDPDLLTTLFLEDLVRHAWDDPILPSPAPLAGYTIGQCGPQEKDVAALMAFLAD